MYMHHEYIVYILTNVMRNVLYIGVTGNLSRRLEEHHSSSIQGFTSRYRVSKLIHCEQYADIRDALEREKQLKGWNRGKKIRLIELQNPDWEEIVL